MVVVDTREMPAAPRPAGLRLAALASALLLSQFACLAPARAADAVAPAFREEMSKQQDIYQSTGTKVPDGYIVYRSLTDYAEVLPAGFDRALERLGPGDRWLDIGAGEGKAILDYYTPEYDRAHPYRLGSKAQAVALSIEDRRTALWWQQAASLAPNQIRYLYSKPLREYPPEELGKFQIITDVFGGFTYTDNLSLFLETVLGLLQVNGSFYSLLQNVRLDDGRDRLRKPEPVYLTEIKNTAGQDEKVCPWLRTIACVKVTCESKSEWESPTELIRIDKVCDNVSVPALQPLRYEAGAPPGRLFQMKEEVASGNR